MKKLFLFIILAVTVQVRLLYASEPVELIFPESFQPCEAITRIDGMFNGYYKVQSQDDISYEEVVFFSVPEFALKYYSHAKRAGDFVKNSMVEIFGQKFSLGFLNNAPTSPRDIMAAAGEFWLVTCNNRKIFCYITNQLGANDPRYLTVLLFDITDERQVQFTIFDTFAFGYQPQIGLYKQKLAILKTDCDIKTGALHTEAYWF